MKELLMIICFCFLCSGDDPPKKKELKKKDSIQVQRSINLEQLQMLNKSYDSTLLKQDTLIKKK